MSENTVTNHMNQLKEELYIKRMSFKMKRKKLRKKNASFEKGYYTQQFLI